MCPNCGMTISLEKRREIDFKLIQDATRKKPENFTRLLHITKLPRKTLALRLRDMCEDEILVKKDGKYRLNGTSNLDNNGGEYTRRFPDILKDRRFRTGLMLIALMIGFSTSGYVLARVFEPSDVLQEPPVLGDFTIALKINNVEDLYTWQVFMTFNSSQLKVISADAGEFLEKNYPDALFCNVTDTGEGELLLGGTLKGIDIVSGIDGSGTLATIVFGYYVNEYNLPQIQFDKKRHFLTFLWDSKLSFIPIEDSTIETIVTP